MKKQDLLTVAALVAGVLLLKKQGNANGVGELPYEKNRKRAAHELWLTAKGYGEKVSEATVYRACFYDPRHGTWRYIGRAYDYTW